MTFYELLNIPKIAHFSQLRESICDKERHQFVWTMLTKIKHFINLFTFKIMEARKKRVRIYQYLLLNWTKILHFVYFLGSFITLILSLSSSRQGYLVPPIKFHLPTDVIYQTNKLDIYLL